MEKAKRISQESVDTMHALSSTTLLIYTVQLEWLASIPWPNSIIIIL